MINPFSNIASKDITIPLQQQKGGAVVKKTRGRPARPNFRKYLIKMDIVLHKKVSTRATELGTSNSFVINEALRKYFCMQ